MAVTPLMIDLTKKSAIIIGGGRVAERRALKLLENGASLTVVSPEAEEGIRKLSEVGRLYWKQKYFEAEDLNNQFLIIAAADNPSVNESVIQAAPPDALINQAADAEAGNVQFPATLRRGKLSLSVSTEGASPMLTSSILRDLETTYGESYEDYVDFLYTCRQKLKSSSLTKTEQRRILKELISKDYLDKPQQENMTRYLENL